MISSYDHNSQVVLIIISWAWPQVLDVVPFCFNNVLFINFRNFSVPLQTVDHDQDCASNGRYYSEIPKPVENVLKQRSYGSITEWWDYEAQIGHQEEKWRRSDRGNHRDSQQNRGFFTTLGNGAPHIESKSDGYVAEEQYWHGDGRNQEPELKF